MVERPTHTPEGKEILYIRRAGRTEAMGYVIIDPKTGATGQTITKHELRDLAKTKSITYLEPEPEVAESIRRHEEIQERKARGEKSPSETWEDYIKRVGTKAKIPSEHIARKYKKELEEAARREAEARPPTRKERIAETLAKQKELERQRRIQETLARQRELGIAREIPEKKPERIPPSEIKVVPKIKLFEKPTELARRFAFKAERAKGIERFKFGAGAFAFGVVKYPIELGRMVAHPIRAIKGITYTVTHFREAGYEFGRRLKYETPVVAGEVTAAVGIGYVAPKAIKGVGKKVIAKRARRSLEQPDCPLPGPKPG